MTYPSNVILHAFDWPFALVTQRAADIAECGYTSVLVSPPNQSEKSPLGTEWWQRYQPTDYRVIDNQLGNTHDFKLMTDTLNGYGVTVYVDVVFNHMANEYGRENHLEFPGQQRLQSYANNPTKYDEIRLFGDLSENLFTAEDFVDFGPITDWECPEQVQNGRISSGAGDYGLPPLACKPHVIDAQQQYLLALKRLGVGGFRIDAAKHLSLEHLNAVFTPEITEGMHVFGEIITDGGVDRNEYQLFLEPYLKETRLSAYDFPRFHAIWHTLTQGKSMTALIDPYSIGQALEYHRAITFVVTHDIPNNDVFLDQVLTEESEAFAYAYIMSINAGVPLIYSDLDTSGINNLAGKPRWKDVYNTAFLKALVRFYHYTFGTTMKVAATKDTLQVTRGSKGIMLLNRSNKAQTFNLPEDLPFSDLLAPEQGKHLNRIAIGAGKIAALIVE
ncbi:alpha-amylase family glycosyl hydrolase [Thaumasiovibrio sp. DFM-14]|uniref:alpha-amylase family glycosyl hydrolase n=1 Tax=Thaumasiovibrio sp. DFM-14 TaxID=3384792 RepID=UPI0039A319A4